jgi:hypothetical protein
MQKTIPARTIITCDICGKENPRRKKKATVKVRRDGLDMYGDPCCDASYSLDLCDDCECEITTAINKLKRYYAK